LKDGNICLPDNCKKVNLINKNSDEKKIAVIFDYYENDNCCSDEFLIYNSKYIIKAGGVESIRRCDSCRNYPPAFFSALGLIYDIYKEETIKHLPKCFDNYDIVTALELIRKDQITGKGGIKDFFKSAAFLIGIDENEMRQIASKHIKDIKFEYEFNIRYLNKKFILGTKDIIYGLLYDIKKREKKEIIAAKFYKSIIDITLFICRDLREMYGTGKVYIAGKMFDEDDNLKLIECELIRSGFEMDNNYEAVCG